LTNDCISSAVGDGVWLPSAKNTVAVDVTVSRGLATVDVDPLGVFGRKYCCISYYTSQDATSLAIRRRPIILGLILLLGSSYLAEALYFAYQQLKENEPTTSHAMFNAISTLFVWTVIAISPSTNSTRLWQPYAGAFGVELVFQIAFGTFIPRTKIQRRIGFIAARAVLSLALGVIAWKPADYHIDEEAPLLPGTLHNQDSKEIGLSRYAIFLPYLCNGLGFAQIHSSTS
jgi:hypothetical protein